MTIAALAPFYLWTKSLHVISMVAWMAAMLYLPRLYVYHCEALPGTESSERFKIMERRLLKAIATPAMLSTILFGTLLALTPGIVDWSSGWWRVKLASVVLLIGCHGAMSRYRKDFLADRNRHPQKFFRILNEIPTVLLVVIVFMVIVKPF